MSHDPSLCEVCTGTCCKLNTYVTDADAMRLVTGGHSIKDFLQARFQWVMEKMQDGVTRSDAEGWWHQQGFDKYVGRLRREGSDCVFLRYRPDGSSRCSAYEYRPEVCRNFVTDQCGGDVRSRELVQIRAHA